MRKIITVLIFAIIGVGLVAATFADPSELVNPADFKYNSCHLIKTSSGDVVMCHVKR